MSRISRSPHEGVVVELARHRTPEQGFDAALRFLVTYLDGSVWASELAVDPTFALGSMRTSLAQHSVIVAQLLGDALAVVPAVANATVTDLEATR